ncbi:MAG TPA: hypothetical protein VIM11_19410, partial [Tepidisphaeraceae bacterium]
MRLILKWALSMLVVLFAVVPADPANGALTAYAVPSGSSNSAWVGVDSGWTGPLNVSPNPFATFRTLQNPNGIWQAWAGPDNQNFPTFDIATRVLSSPLSVGQTFRLGYEAPAGTFAIGQIGSNNSASVAWSIASLVNYAYSDSGVQQADTGIASGTPVDIQLTYMGGMSPAYNGTMSVIGNPLQTFSWSGILADTVDGFYLQNSGSSVSQSLGIRYIEVGS